jgi:uncharacterized C2H2 Zn-finger protein
MPTIDVILNPIDQSPVEFTGKVFNGWKCPRTGLVFRFKSAYLKHLKQLARSEQNRKKAERGEVDGNSILYKPAISETPDKHQRHAYARAKDFLNKAYGFNNWDKEDLVVLSDYILTVAISKSVRRGK